MSLEIARSIAVSSLMASQVQISVASSNISNADTTGYTVKTANQVATTSGGAGTGVSITGITSSVDKLLFKSLISATSELGAANTNNDYLNRLPGALWQHDRGGRHWNFDREHAGIAGIRHIVARRHDQQCLAASQCGEYA